MQANYDTESGTIRSFCPKCKCVTNFFNKDTQREFGSFSFQIKHPVDYVKDKQIVFRLYRCAACNIGGLAELCKTGRQQTELISFHPSGFEKQSLPDNVPPEIKKEFEEAEKCAEAKAWRAASAMCRSALEKLLVLNGYSEGNLFQKIDNAAADGVIIVARKKRAHDIRSIGNDVLHDPWEEYSEEDFQSAYEYLTWITRDFYDDWNATRDHLVDKGRLPKK